jgi:NAD(P)-dependent dehydrogenase (short-subunit alcohol dehydrogenase family)
MAYEIDLSGRVAFVTGASSGLGAQFARTLARAGAGVVLAARRIERLKTLRAEIEAAGGDAHVVALDVTDPHSIRAAVAHAETEMGTIDVLVNNSGVSTTQRLVDVTPEDFDLVMNTNLRGAFFVAQEVGKRMIARSRGTAPGTFTGGRIVNIASMAGLRVMSQIGVYAMSKAAVEVLARALRVELAPFGASATSVHFGFIDTDMVHQALDTDPEVKGAVDALPSPLRRRLKPEHAAAAVVAGIETRAPRVITPGVWKVFFALRGIIAPLLDARAERHAGTRRSMERLHDRAGEELKTTA